MWLTDPLENHVHEAVRAEVEARHKFCFMNFGAHMFPKSLQNIIWLTVIKKMPSRELIRTPFCTPCIFQLHQTWIS